MPLNGPAPAPLTLPGRTALLPKNTILTEAGRPPWYGKDGQCQNAYVIGIGGGSASGKTRVAQEVLKKIGVPWVVVISQDSFYKALTPEQSKAAFRNEHDFDAPASFDEEVLRECIDGLRAGQSVQLPNYSFAHHARTDKTTYIYGATVVIVEGIHVLHHSLRDLYDLKIFVQCDSDLMLARRLRRDLVERGRDASGVIDQYLRFVKPAFDNHIQPTSRFADIIVPGAMNEVSVELIASHIRRQLEERKREIRKELFVETEGGVAPASHASTDGGAGDGLPETVLLMEQTSQLRGIHTLLRDRTTSASDFIFYANRLSTLVIERSLSLLPHRVKPITTRTSIEHDGQELDIDPGHLVGVSILRSGASLEKGLRRVVRDVAVGSMLIQSDDRSGEPCLYSVRLPDVLTASRQSASKTWVLLLDSQIGTGAAALMAVRVLLDHGVRPGRIIICAILVSKMGGVWALKRAFPEVRIVSSAADDGLEERWEKKKDGSGTKKVFAILPGLGSYGDRYFQFT